MVVSHILLSTPRLLLKRSQLNVDGPLALGLIGLVGTIINYALRSLPTFGGRYFYWLYLLMLPASALAIRSVSKKFASLIAAITLISLISFYGVQDPTLSANTYGKYIGWADSHSWRVAQDIASLMPSYVTFIGDPRMGAPLSYLRFYMNITIEYPPLYQAPQLLIAGNDWIGDRTIKGAESWYHISLLDRQRDVVFTTCSYTVHHYLS